MATTQTIQQRPVDDRYARLLSLIFGSAEVTAQRGEVK